MRSHLVVGQAVVWFAALAVVAVGGVRAQEGTAPVPAAAPAAVAAVDGAMATVLVETTKLRCWPTANSPLYGDSFVKDAVLRVGRSEAGFREILLPIGPLGFVHKNFAGELQPDGIVVSKGKGVAFRYRPRSGEAPVTSLADSTKLLVVGAEDDWWCVRHPGVAGWLPETDLQVFPTPPETLQKAHAAFEALQRGQVTAWLDGIKAAAAARELADSRRQALAELQERFGKELQKAPKEQQLDEVGKAVESLLADAGDDEALQFSLKELQRRIGAQKWVAEATAVRDEQPVPAADIVAPPPGVVADPMERFQAVGFLRWQKGLTGPGSYVVEKGGQLLYYVQCSSGRYDLGLFVDCEVGLIGTRRRPTSDSLRVLEVEKLEVLAARP